jgi:hypothetical protein
MKTHKKILLVLVIILTIWSIFWSVVEPITTPISKGNPVLFMINASVISFLLVVAMVLIVLFVSWLFKSDEK